MTFKKLNTLLIKLLDIRSKSNDVFECDKHIDQILNAIAMQYPSKLPGVEFKVSMSRLQDLNGSRADNK